MIEGKVLKDFNDKKNNLKYYKKGQNSRETRNQSRYIIPIPKKVSRVFRVPKKGKRNNRL